MNNTKLMDKLFSEENEELRTQVADKVEEAKQNGSSELITDEENLQFADTGDGIVVEDQANNNEVTMMKENEDGDGYDMEAVDVTAETKSNSDDELNEKMTTLEENVNEVANAAEDMTETKDKEMAKAVKEMSQKLFSDIEDLEKEHEDINFEEVKEKCNEYAEMAEEILNGPDVKTEVVESEDGKHITDSQPEVKVEVSTGINDAEKAGLKNFSLTFSGNCDPSYIAAVSKAFADVVPASPKAEDAQKPENSKNEALETLIENANELAEAAKQMKEANDKDMAKSVKEMSQKIFSEAEELEVEDEDKMKVEEVKENCKQYSDEADEIINKLEEKVDEIKQEIKEVKEDKKDDEKTEDAPKSDEATQKNFSACLNHSFNGMDISPRSDIKTEQKTFSKVDNKEVYSNPCLTVKI